jgi:hypothetical protein
VAGSGGEGILGKFPSSTRAIQRRGLARDERDPPDVGSFLSVEAIPGRPCLTLPPASALTAAVG